MNRFHKGQVAHSTPRPNWYMRQSKNRTDGLGCKLHPNCLRDRGHEEPCKLYVAPVYREPRPPQPRGVYQDHRTEIQRLSDEAHERVYRIRDRGEEYPGEMYRAGEISHGPTGWNIFDEQDYPGEILGGGVM